MSYREPQLPLCLENPKLISLGRFLLQMVLCFALISIANGSILLWEPQWWWCHLPRKVSKGERGNGGIWHLLRYHSHVYPHTPHELKTLLILGIMFLITTSGTPVSQPCPHILPDWGRLALLVGGHCVRILRCPLVPCSASAADTDFVSMERAHGLDVAGELGDLLGISARCFSRAFYSYIRFRSASKHLYNDASLFIDSG